MSDLFDELMDLLEKERMLIANGEYENLARFNELKLSLVERLRGKGSRRLVDDILPELRRNEALLAACRDGLRQARDRISDIRRGLGQLSVYGADGRLSDIPTRRPDVFRSA